MSLYSEAVTKKNSHPPFHCTRKWLKKQPTSMNELAIAYLLAGISVINNGTKTKRLYDYGVQVLWGRAQ